MDRQRLPRDPAEEDVEDIRALAGLHGRSHLLAKVIVGVDLVTTGDAGVRRFELGDQLIDVHRLPRIDPPGHRRADRGRVGEQYNIGGHNEKRNLDIVEHLCALLDELRPESAHRPHRALVTFVEDRKGHDLRYAIDAGKIERELGWTPAETFETGIRKTVQWYLANQAWCRTVQDRGYSRQRLGLGRER